MPTLRRLAREFDTLPRAEAARLLQSRWHEARMLALFVLVRQYGRATRRERAAIAALYLRSRRRINNWDLVDCSAAQILGAHLVDRDRAQLRRLARSHNLWDRRMAAISTFQFIKRSDFADALAIAEALLDDPQDLIHKAVGWMLREIGNRDLAVEKGFLDCHAARMPRTMLRYAIEKFPPGERRRYLSMRHV